MPDLDLVPYTESLLAQLLYAKQYQISPNDILNDPHVVYLTEYLGTNGLQATYVLTEHEYISRDYLDGFASYYALSFQVPIRNCKRLHFFSSPEPPEAFRQLLTQAILNTDGQSDRFWNDVYLGFIVVKPLAVCNIGVTVLKHYNYNSKGAAYNKARHIWATRTYVCHVYGRKVSIDSLAFQEQDTNLAACASVAVWTVLQVTDHEQPVLRKSPGRLTHDAGLTARNGNRLVPNAGLSAEQICTVLTANGLMTEVRDFEPDRNGRFDMDRLRRLVDAYSGLKIPIILTMLVPGDDGYDGHAVAIAGYERPKRPPIDPPVADGSKPMVHRADGIAKFYVHDDGWGCFARMVVDPDSKGIHSAWTMNGNGEEPESLCLPMSLIIPVPSKVRISYEEISAFVHFSDLLLKAYFDEAERATAMSWDIRLEYSETLKQYVAALPYWSTDRYSALKLAILRTSMPKYVWVATCFWEGVETMNIIFDATEMKNGLLGLHMIFHGYEEQQFVRERLRATTDAKRESWGFLKNSYTDYCLYFMQEQCSAFIVPY